MSAVLHQAAKRCNALARACSSGWRMKPDTHQSFSTQALVRSPNRVMFGFTLPTDSRARTWQYSTQPTARSDRTWRYTEKFSPSSRKLLIYGKILAIGRTKWIGRIFQPNNSYAALSFGGGSNPDLLLRLRVMWCADHKLRAIIEEIKREEG